MDLLALDGITALFDAAAGLLGWRSAIGIVTGVTLAGALYWLHRPARNDAWALAAVASICWVAGLWWEHAASRAPAISAMNSARPNQPLELPLMVGAALQPGKHPTAQLTSARLTRR